MKPKVTSSARAATATVVKRQWVRPSDEARVTPPRELAQRVSGAVEVLLLWYSETGRVELAVRERATGVEFCVEVAPSLALDAFYHPYAYAASGAAAHE
jgi:hypothetical protein